MSHRILIALLPLVLSASGLSGCGMRGDLYLPEDEAREEAGPPVTEAPAESTPAETDKE